MDGWTPWGIKHRVTRVLPHDVHAMSFKVSMPAMCAFLAQMSIRYACEGHADSKDFPRVYSRFNMSVLNTLKWWVKHHVACPHFRDPVFVNSVIVFKREAFRAALHFSFCVGQYYSWFSCIITRVMTYQ